MRSRGKSRNGSATGLPPKSAAASSSACATSAPPASKKSKESIERRSRVAVVKAARRSGGRDILLGETTGALLAAAAARHLRASDKLVLQGPWLKPLRQAFDPDENLVGGAVPLDGAAAAILPREEQLAFSRGLLDRFYGAWADRDPIALLTARPPSDMLVVYGDRDEEIGLERMPALLAVGGKRHRSLMLCDAGHAAIATRADLDRLVAELAR